MNSPRVNLLEKSEQRHQGPVSRRFAIICAIVTPILLIAVLGTAKLVQLQSLQDELEVKNREWASIQPRVGAFNKKKAQLAENRALIDLFTSWEASTLPIVDFMEEIQMCVQTNMQPGMQLLRLELSGGRGKTTYYRTPAEMALEVELHIDGKAQGEQAVNDIWKFQDDLQVCDTISEYFASVKLESPRSSGGPGGVPVMTFTMNGSDEKGRSR